MWLPLKEKIKEPEWDTEKLLKGVNFCFAHPLYHAESFKKEKIFAHCQ